MSVIYVLIPLAIIIILIAIGIFFWAVKSDQFNDLERQGYSILFDEDIQSPSNVPETDKEAKEEQLDNGPSHATNQQSSPSERKTPNK